MKSASQVLATPLSSNRLRFWTIRTDHSIWSSCECKPRYYRPWERDTDRWNPEQPRFEATWGAAVPLSDASLQFWAVDTEGRIWSCREAASDPAIPWTAWTADWARAASRLKVAMVAAAPLSDRCLQFWAVDTAGAIWSCWTSSTSPASRWTKWTDKWTPRRPPFKAVMVAAAPLPDRRLQFWAVDESGQIWSCCKSTTKSTARWTAWTKDWAPAPPFKAAMVAAAPLSDARDRSEKRVQIWAVDESGEIWSCRQSANAPSSPWTEWTKNWIPSPPVFKASMVAVAPMVDGRLQLWAVDENGEIWSCWKTEASVGANWTIFGLFFNMQSQQHGYWCWAATAASLSHYFDPASSWCQCDIVNAILSNSTCCDNGGTTGCNQPTFLKPVLDLTGNFDRSVIGAATEEMLISEFKSGRPVAVRMYSPGKGGHFVVVCGCGDSMVMVKDPWDGPTCIAYDVFRDKYMGTHSWHTSFFTKP